LEDHVNPRKNLAWIGFVAYALAWFMPTLMVGSRTTPPMYSKDPDSMGGAQAFVWALLEPLDLNESTLGHWALDILAGCSALTNVLMLIVLGAMALGKRVRPRWTWCLIGAGILNAWWLARFTDDLLLGYYLWWLSFFVVGYAARTSPRLPSVSESAGPSWERT
jgi:hypothetical protein